MAVIFPKTLKKGDKIAVVSPAGSVEEGQILSTLELIKSKGYDPVLSPHCLGRFSFGYSYSGTEKQRIADLNWALNSDEVSAIWATRGGYGCQHLLGHLKLNNFKENPKWYIGYSDNTVIQSFLLKKGFASIHGQTLKTSSFGVSTESYAEGVLVGGNLALVYALLGSSYSVDFRDKSLFIEDIGENFYSLDRMLISLDLAGVFRKIKGIIIGGMINMGNEAENPDYEYSYDAMAYEIIAERLKKYSFPKLFAFPNGHIFDNVPLILGSEIKLNVSETEAKVEFL